MEVFNKRYSDLAKFEATSDELVKTLKRRSTNVTVKCRLLSCVNNLIWISCVDRSLRSVRLVRAYCELTIWYDANWQRLFESFTIPAFQFELIGGMLSTEEKPKPKSKRQDDLQSLEANEGSDCIVTCNWCCARVLTSRWGRARSENETQRGDLLPWTNRHGKEKESNQLKLLVIPKN